jgi:hypothetical protein
MTADQLAAFLAEAVPDGTFGGARTLRPRRGTKPQPKAPDPRAAEHRAALEAAIRPPRRAA